VPLAYQPGFVLRGDLKLSLVQSNESPAFLSGEIALRDGLFLQELDSLVPGRRTHPLERPPFFSVEERPFSDWKLDVKIAGENCLRVRSPYLRAEVSADFQLKGTLEEPVALGEARITSGRVSFPFGTLQVDSATASLASDDPYEPKLAATASGRCYGYDVRMELSGTARQPVITFNSTPPLTSEQILLMLAAGSPPRDDYSSTAQQKAAALAIYLSKSALSQWLGLEDSIERLTIRSGEEVTVQGTTTYSVEYKISDDWSIVGEYDRFGALNIGMKWRIYSR